MTKFKFYITTAIDYTNSKPHLGHAYEKVFADALARWHRLKGDDVFFLTGTDEHGLKVQKAAEKAGKNPKEFVDEIVRYFKELCKVLNISNDDFIRTTEKRHIDVAIEIFKKILDKKEIYKGIYEGLYCTSCETFYLAKDLVNGLCPIHKTKPELVKEESYFFKLSKYQKQIVDHINKNKNFVLPEERRNEILKRLEEPLRDLSVSRSSFEWGIPLPNDKKHILYVWLDALTNYISALGYPKEEFKKYWPADLHIIGKDILWHHSVIWSAILLATGIPLPKSIFVHGFVNIGGEKLSKARGITIDPVNLVKKYGADSLRYFLLREIPAGHDGDFSEKALVERLNGDLADGLGNLVNRILVLVEKNLDSRIPAPNKSQLEEDDKKLLDVVSKIPEKVSIALDNYQFNVALDSIFHLVSVANKYINDVQPWKIKDKERLENVLYILLETLRYLAILLHPFIPETSEKIFDQLNLKKQFNIKDLRWGIIKGEIKRGKVLFEKVGK